MNPALQHVCVKWRKNEGQDFLNIILVSCIEAMVQTCCLMINFQIAKVTLNLFEVSEIKWASLDEIMYLYFINKYMYNNSLVF